jgi:glycosyltransferase involved in cell wall biosynthesis
MNTKKIKLLIIHPFDPLGNKIGGIQTFIKNLVKYGPDGFEIYLVGVTSDKELRQKGKWQKLEVLGRRIDFLPVLYVKDENKRSRVPLSLKFTAALIKYRKLISTEDKILEFHRIEPILPFINMLKKSILTIHCNTFNLSDKHNEVKWKRFPWLYFILEKILINKVEKIFIVRRDSVGFYKRKYSFSSDKFFFLPTWVDTDIFYSVENEITKKEIKKYFCTENNLSYDSKFVVFVGRLEGIKDPMLLVDTFHLVSKHNPEVQLLIVGTGAFKRKMQERARDYGISEKIYFLGVLSQNELADIMRMGNVFLLTSASEGMPRSVLEALACGLPVVTTEAGEVDLVVKDNFSGYVCRKRDAKNLGDSVLKILREKNIKLQDCVKSIEPYTAEKIIGNFCDQLRKLNINV